MFRKMICAAALFAPTYAISEETRSHEAHVHGVSTLGVVVDGDQLLLDLKAPAADVVGFERAPNSDEERAKLEAALALLEQPEMLFGIPTAAKCARTAMETAFEIDDHDEHGEEGHEDDKHDHDDHAEEGHEEGEHGHDDHAEDKHSEDHEDEHAHEEHDEHGEETHAEFEGEYQFKCAAADALDKLELKWFENFASAEKMNVLIVRSDAQFEASATADAPIVSLKAPN